MNLTERAIVDQVAALLTALFGTCRREGHAAMLVGRGSFAQEQRYLAGRPSDLLPSWLLTELSYQTPDDVRVGLATRSDGQLVDLPALFCEFQHTPAFNARVRRWEVAAATS